jgi:outer membrane protein
VNTEPRRRVSNLPCRIERYKYKIDFYRHRRRRMHLKKLGVIIGIMMLGIVLSGGAASSAELKVGIVDIQKAINDCQAGKEAKKAIIKEAEKFQGLVQQRQKDLQTLKETLEKQSPMLTQDARQAKEKELQGKMRDFQRWGEDSQNEINQKRIEMEKTISVSLQKLIQKLGADEGFSLIMEKNEQIVLYASKALDITDRVIKAHDLQKK